MFIRRLKLRLRYHYRAFMFAIGYCPDCMSRTYRTKSGYSVFLNKLNH